MYVKGDLSQERRSDEAEASENKCLWCYALSRSLFGPLCRSLKLHCPLPPTVCPISPPLALLCAPLAVCCAVAPLWENFPSSNPTSPRSVVRSDRCALCCGTPSGKLSFIEPNQNCRQYSVEGHIHIITPEQHSIISSYHYNITLQECHDNYDIAMLY